jgi:hypothetical protein
LLPCSSQIPVSLSPPAFPGRSIHGAAAFPEQAS